MNQREKEGQRQLWIVRVCELGESYLMQEEWCKNHNIPYSTLRYWLGKLRKESETECRETNWLRVNMSEGIEIGTLQIHEKEKNKDSYMIISLRDVFGIIKTKQRGT